MSSANCGKVFKRILKVIYLLCAVLTVVGLLVGYGFIYRFLEAPPSTLNRERAPADSKDQTLYRLSWEGDKTEYEAKVYASQLKTVDENNAAKFFEEAQELWHIEPHALEDRYPSYKTRVKVNVPLKALEKRPNALYAHIFIQQKGKLAPHPDVTDPFMVHSRAELAHWKPVYPAPVDSALSFIKFESDMVVDYELVATKGVSWAMVLENHAFTKKELPFGIVIPNSSPSKDKSGKTVYTYNVPLMQNMFTRNDWPEKKLSLQGAPQTMDVALELQGIKLRWIKPKMVAMLMMPAANNLTMTPITVPVADPKHPERGTKMVRFKPALYVGGESLVDFVGSRGLHVYLHAALALIAACAVQMVLGYVVISFFFQPKSAWVGLSRTSFVIQVALHFLSTLVLAPSIGFVSAVLNPFNSIVVYYVLVMFDIPRDPRKWREYWKNRRLSQDQQPGYQLLQDTELDEAPLSAYSSSSSSSSSSNISERNNRALPNNDSDDEEGAASAATMASSPVPIKVDPLEHITNIRKSVDRVAMRWLVLSVGPTLVLTSLLTLFSSKPMSLGSVLAFFVQLCTFLSYVYGAVWLVPQLLVNRRAQSGSLLPPAFHVCVVVLGVVMVVLMCALQLPGVLAKPLWIGYWVSWACNLVAVGQWIKYRSK
ncbi:hypothetical protein LPJ59_002146 [Coemansia sp. RSA 2399]|nr:hypothetical protein LPJ59_002146 [Coemansia sp. RSA 2399]KAJ1903316.1 hypothetical protein LPJ81_003126 [Coemansia sp. IMI 209127]